MTNRGSGSGLSVVSSPDCSSMLTRHSGPTELSLSETSRLALRSSRRLRTYSVAIERGLRPRTRVSELRQHPSGNVESMHLNTGDRRNRSRNRLSTGTCLDECPIATGSDPSRSPALRVVRCSSHPSAVVREHSCACSLRSHGPGILYMGDWTTNVRGSC